MTWQSVQIWLKSKSHLITAYKVALIQKPIDEIDSNLAILQNECLERFKKRYKVFTHSNGALAVTLIGFFMNITC
jgi:hypothetical protein